jgi:signal peptidase I
MDQYFTDSQPDPEPSEQKRSSSQRFMLDMLETLLLSAAIFLVLNFISARIRIESVSMQPTLYENDFVLVNRLAYKLGQPSRGDVIVFHAPPAPNEEPYIKRVVGLPGDFIEVKDRQVFVNGNPINEPYIKEAPTYDGNWQVPQGALFVLGDNRNNSSDSHAWGFVPLENVIGTAKVVYLPPSHWKSLVIHTAQAAGP